jgi:hypothetical protein
VSKGASGGSTPLKMVTCGRCKAKTFRAGDLAPFAVVPCKKCGHPVMLPVLLRNFELRSIIASGGMGTVYTARDIKLEREVALKMMKREMAADPEIMQAFYREARAAAALNHTNIIHIYSFDELEGQPYLVMELADQGKCLNWTFWMSASKWLPLWPPPSNTTCCTATSNPATFYTTMRASRS